MKRLIDFTTIAFPLLLTAVSGVGSLETLSATEASVPLENSVIVAQAETTSKFVTADKNYFTVETLSIITD